MSIGMLDNLFSAVAGFLFKLLYDKISDKHPKVVFNVEPIKGFIIPPQDTGQTEIQIWQHSLHISNWGKTPATNIIITHDYLAHYRNISPHAITKIDVNDANKVITIRTLAPKEGITIGYLDMHNYSTITTVVFDQGVATHIPLMVTLPPKKWATALLTFLAITGAGFLAYLAWSYFPACCKLLSPAPHS